MISPQAVVQTDDIGKGVDIAEFAVIRPDVSIGRGVRIHPHVVVESGVRLEDDVEVFAGAYLGKEPKGTGATARTIEYERRVFIGRSTSVGPHAVIFCDVEIGAETLIGDGASIREQCRVGSRCIISRYVTVNYNTRIGDGTRIMDSTHITGNSVIGNDVFISALVSTANDNEMVTRRYEEGKIIGPHVGDRVSVGEGACLLPAIRIGEGAIIGAGSVVTKDVDPYVLVMGVPARYVRDLENPDNPKNPKRNDS
jgi:acetyltransferase-like isoleucine patch superfamily enzyme